jgi:hypothetical protein
MMVIPGLPILRQQFFQGASVYKSMLVLACVCVSLSITGCFNKGPKLVEAKGILTMNGAPLSDASVVVHYPDATSATGVSDAKGEFSLTYNGRNGAVPGSKLKVSVSKTASAFDAKGMTVSKSAGGGPTPEQIKSMQDQGAKMMADNMKKNEGNKSPGGKSEVAAKFTKPDTSGLDVTIPEGGTKELKIDLKS